MVEIAFGDSVSLVKDGETFSTSVAHVADKLLAQGWTIADHLPPAPLVTEELIVEDIPSAPVRKKQNKKK